jgi:prepilin-type N-terminal cleavage/methylation domain-containing protein
MNQTTLLPLQKARRPFTLVELLAVIAILVILMGIGVGAFSYTNRRIADTRTRTLMKQIEMAMESYKQEFGYYVQMAPIGNLTVIPFTDTRKDFSDFLDFETLKQNNTNLSGGFYTFIDAYGSPLRYRCPGRKNKTSFDLGSIGPDAMYGDNGKSITAANDAQPPPPPAPDVYDFWGKGDDITNFTP